MSHITRKREARECNEEYGEWNMPCRDDRDACSDRYDKDREQYDKEIAELKSELNKVTDLLCTTCSSIEADGPFSIEDNPELKIWWEKHKQEDADREARESEEEKAALTAIMTAVDYLKKYLDMAEDMTLPQVDRDYFKQKILDLEHEIERHISKFPRLGKVILEVMGADK